MIDCIIAPQKPDPKGYVRVSINGVTKSAHRVAYEEAFGPIPEGMTIDHLCATKACIEPTHMEVVTRAENTSRSWRDGRHAFPPTCPKGHNRWGRNGRGGRSRRCLDCHRDAARAARA